METRRSRKGPQVRMHRHNNQRRPGGFGLAELMVSVAVIIPVALVAVGIFPFSWLVNAQASHVAFAHDVARTAMESVRAADFDDVPASRTTTARDTRGFDYTCVTTATARGTQLKDVTVTVSWTDHKAESLHLVTTLVRSGR